jgi:hypothetical protein
MADATPLNGSDVKLDNAPTETTQAGSQETAQASTVFVGDNLASNVVSKTTNDLDQDQEKLVSDAQEQALQNHAVEHANDPTPTTGDKTVV